MRREFSGIDVVRFLAALHVTAFHLGYWLWRDGNSHRLPELEPYFSSGWVGVELFFVISGFVIALSATGKTAGEFLGHRFLRLYPAVWICASITVAFAPAPWSTYFRSLVLFPLSPWVSIAYWTLPLEMSFYGLVAIAIWRRIALTRIALLLGYFSVAYWALRLGNSPDALLVPPFLDSELGSLLLPQFGAFFALGILLATRGSSSIHLAFFLAAGLAEIATRAVTINAQYAWLAPAVFIAGLGLIILSIFRKQQVDSVLHRIPTRTIGLMTYPLYLLHAEVGVAIQRSVANPYAGFFIAIIALIILSFAVLPLEGALRRFLTDARMAISGGAK